VTLLCHVPVAAIMLSATIINNHKTNFRFIFKPPAFSFSSAKIAKNCQL